MAKIIVAVDSVSIVSDLKKEDIELIQKYRPEALQAKDEDGNLTFGISLGRTPKINEYGVAYTSVTKDGEKKAALTLPLGEVDEDADIKEVVADVVGGGILKLNSLEKTLPDVLSEIKEEKKAILESIELVVA